MKRLKIFKAYFVLWLFVYFIAITNLETFKLYFLSTLTFNIAIVSLLAIGTFMLLRAAKDLTMITGTFGVIMYRKGDISFYLKGIEKIFPSTIASKIKDRAQKQMLYFTNQEADDILAWLEEKYSNQNRYNNFFIGTVLMIGLLGTFAGLLGSISSMGNIVSSLAGDSVDIGKIMAEFASPLSSMAVGFGSSLFGVISAVLLSIKGYLLNKAQESLLSGVENWLQSRRVDESLNESEDESKITKVRDRSYMDIFIEEMSLLKEQIGLLSYESRESKESLNKIIAQIEQERVKSHKAMLNISEAFRENSRLNQESIKTLSKVADSINSLGNSQESWREDLKRRDYIITNMLSKQEKRDEELKIGIFQVVDAIENMSKELSKKDKTQKNKHSKIGEIDDFLRHHLFQKEDS